MGDSVTLDRQGEKERMAAGDSIEAHSVPFVLLSMRLPRSRYTGTRKSRCNNGMREIASVCVLIEFFDTRRHFVDRCIEKQRRCRARYSILSIKARSATGGLQFCNVQGYE